jgi:hypothetical protein
MGGDLVLVQRLYGAGGLGWAASLATSRRCRWGGKGAEAVLSCRAGSCASWAAPPWLVTSPPTVCGSPPPQSVCRGSAGGRHPPGQQRLATAPKL